MLGENGESQPLTGDEWQAKRRELEELGGATPAIAARDEQRRREARRFTVAALAASGENQFQAGNFLAAANNLSWLVKMPSDDEDSQERAASLARLAISQRRLGRHEEALASFRRFRAFGKFPSAAPDDKVGPLALEVERLFAVDNYDWTPLNPTATTSAGGATLERQEDGSILVSGVNPPNDTYTVVCETDLPRIAALRLDVLRDKRLPSGGPGRLENGTFVLTGVEASVQSRTDPSRIVKLGFRKALADYVQPSWDPQAMLASGPNGGWAIWREGNPPLQDQSLVLEGAEPVEFDGGAKLTITLRHQSRWPEGNLGRFRLSVSKDVARGQ
jgi:hypothetical protein